MKKTIKSLLVFCMVFLGLVVLASCEMGGGTTGGEEPAGCQHQAGTSWRASETEHWHICDLCSEQVDNAAHQFGDWVVMQEPAVGTAGRKVKTCSVCRYYIDESIPAIEVVTGETTGDTMVFAQVPADWSDVNIYYWHNEAGTNNLPSEHAVGWPGKPMTLVDAEANIWGFVVPVGTANVIFNNGSTQTVDIPFALEANLYILSDAAGGDGKFTANVGTYEYEGAMEDLNKYPTNAAVTYSTIYVQLPAAWAGHNIHTWGSANGTSWPGDAMDVVDAAKNIYSYDLASSITGFLFDEGDGMAQTGDLAPAEGVNGYVVEVKDGAVVVTPCAYADGVFTPVEVQAAPVVYYVRGTMNEWGTNDSYKLAYDEATDTATITVTLNAGDTFKIAEESWNNATTISAENASYETTCFADAGGNDHNISVLVAGTYVITVTGVNSDIRTCSIVAAE